jgi:hypothetical protein
MKTKTTQSPSPSPTPLAASALGLLCQLIDLSVCSKRAPSFSITKADRGSPYSAFRDILTVQTASAVPRDWGCAALSLTVLRSGQAAAAAAGVARARHLVSHWHGGGTVTVTLRQSVWSLPCAVLAVTGHARALRDEG